MQGIMSDPPNPEPTAPDGELRVELLTNEKGTLFCAVVAEGEEVLFQTLTQGTPQDACGALRRELRRYGDVGERYGVYAQIEKIEAAASLRSSSA